MLLYIDILGNLLAAGAVLVTCRRGRESEEIQKNWEGRIVSIVEVEDG